MSGGMTCATRSARMPNHLAAMPSLVTSSRPRSARTYACSQHSVGLLHVVYVAILSQLGTAADVVLGLLHADAFGSSHNLHHGASTESIDAQIHVADELPALSELKMDRPCSVFHLGQTLPPAGDSERFHCEMCSKGDALVPDFLFATGRILFHKSCLYSFNAPTSRRARICRPLGSRHAHSSSRVSAEEAHTSR